MLKGGEYLTKNYPRPIFVLSYNHKQLKFTIMTNLQTAAAQRIATYKADNTQYNYIFACTFDNVKNKTKEEIKALHDNAKAEYLKDTSDTYAYDRACAYQAAYEIA